MVDIAILVIVVLALIGGWRQGALTSVLSTVGVIAGLIIGAAIAPFAMSYTSHTALRFLLAIGIVVFFLGMGNLVGGIAGTALRDSMPFKSFQLADSAIGSVFQALATLVVVWLLAIPLATSAPDSIATSIRSSKTLSVVDRFTPAMLDSLPARISAMLTDTGLPPLISPFNQPNGVEVEAPDIQVQNVALVEELRPSVIHVMAEATQCSRRLMGSGFVAANDYVVTNAHVVAGADTVRLDTVIGVRIAEVVYFDPAEDIAVLHSQDLGLEPLQWADGPAVTGQDSIVMGFPESGPFEAAPARVREEITVNGPNIYASGMTQRQAYTVRGSIRQGNSGGPMVDLNGNVLGVVFGAAIDDTDTGYVLTSAEVRNKIGPIQQLTSQVDTQGCVAK
ncbi:MarP family serine protease [Corynebacterium canis]|uniref:MarP family serine protease n=1 Tax=Corynebacterium canis TaxID=679663 RepID=A0A5C5UIJ8_9CORY|nr:MarP family serine protease [Corynebacterium canis]TWT25667.1 MarP family serine protease [Corynebacterium canis]WJY74027.1 Serine protease [Corynebacterium canis]